ncbi:MAG: hypothetical protein QNJ60_15615 [Xenococcaceae cyanobacterium MO_188.B19]|nr:hypothetical protein [Xenococcaceae cyanobacterium MO_188.B19]
MYWQRIAALIACCAVGIHLAIILLKLTLPDQSYCDLSERMYNLALSEVLRDRKITSKSL